MSKKYKVKVLVEDGTVGVQSDGGEILYNRSNNGWLWLLNAIAFPDEFDIEITDCRTNRQEHQRDLTTAKDGG